MARHPEQMCFEWYAAELQAEANRNAADRAAAIRDHAAFLRSHRSERERFAALEMN
jgi:hypothetical protein